MTKADAAAILESVKSKPTKAQTAIAGAYDLGALVEYAYQMYDSDPGNLKPALPPGFPTTRYTVISYILFSDFFGSGWTQRFYGLFVKDNSATDTYVIAIRGTQGWEEWWDDAHILPKPYPAGGQVESGFFDIYNTMAVGSPAAKTFTAGSTLFDDIAARAGAGRATFHIVGHSLGSALANFVALDAAMRLAGRADVPLTTFACPLTGDQKFVDLLETYVPNNTRIVNAPDIVPDIPPGMGYKHVNTEFLVNSEWLPNVKRSYGCYHALLTYLYCLNQGSSFGLGACKT